MSIEADKSVCCCFTGHRPNKLNINETKARELIEIAVRDAVSKGYRTFISGMAPGIDFWAAQIILRYKAVNPKISLVCAVPYRSFVNCHQLKDRSLYGKILAEADCVEFICSQYKPYSFHMRNIWMVNRSSLVIAAYNGQRGGTRNTVNYAAEQGILVCNILNML